MRARELDETERMALMEVLERIERAGAAVAAECGAVIQVERDDRGRFPLIAFRAHGLRPTRAEPSDTA